jgi:iron(III) transport system permease protein
MSTACEDMACSERRPFRFPGYIRNLDGWQIAPGVIASAVVIPLVVIFSSFFKSETAIWRHITDHLLPELLLNTVILSSGVIGTTAVLGIGLAWLTAVCDFPGRKFLSWALLMPMAIPAYVLAFVFLGVFDFGGPVQSFFRTAFPGRFTPIDVRSAPGVILVLSLGLYPYVYLLTRGAFLTQGRKAMEAARSLGRRPLSAFFHVSLPMARPWIAGGLMLVLMETLADFGAVSVFNYDTFTTAIYKAWFGLFSLHAAAQLSSLLVIMALVIMLVEQRMRHRMRFFQSGRLSMEGHRFQLRGIYAWSATLFCGGVFWVAFGLPFLQLLGWSVEAVREQVSAAYLAEMINSLVLSSGGAILIVTAALVLAYAARRHSDIMTALTVRIATLGYALPGTVLAVGLFIGLSAVDHWMADRLGLEPVLQGSLVMLYLAYGVRFLAVGYHPITSAMLRITPSIDEAARSFGTRGLKLLTKIHVPILRSGLLTAALLGFVDIMKEMPMTLMTRPFGWDTLAVKIYELTSEGEWERAAIPSVFLVLCGLIPVILLILKSEKRLS